MRQLSRLAETLENWKQQLVASAKLAYRPSHDRTHPIRLPACARGGSRPDHPSDRQSSKTAAMSGQTETRRHRWCCCRTAQPAALLPAGRHLERTYRATHCYVKRENVSVHKWGMHVALKSSHVKVSQAGHRLQDSCLQPIDTISGSMQRYSNLLKQLQGTTKTDVACSAACQGRPNRMPAVLPLLAQVHCISSYDRRYAYLFVGYVSIDA